MKKYSQSQSHRHKYISVLCNSVFFACKSVKSSHTPHSPGKAQRSNFQHELHNLYWATILHYTVIGQEYSPLYRKCLDFYFLLASSQEAKCNSVGGGEILKSSCSQNNQSMDAPQGWALYGKSGEPLESQLVFVKNCAVDCRRKKDFWSDETKVFHFWALTRTVVFGRKPILLIPLIKLAPQ